jgi:hypothetical protein
MLVDIFLPRWVPFDSFNQNEDVPGSIAAADTAKAHQWKHFIAGHMGRLGTRADMALYQQYVNDIIDGVKKALAAVDPAPYFAKYGKPDTPRLRPSTPPAKESSRAPYLHHRLHRRTRPRRRRRPHQ